VAEHALTGDLGYGAAPAAAVDAVSTYLLTAYQWRIEPEWIVWMPGVVTGLHMTCRLSAGNLVLGPTPVYGPFMTAPTQAGKTYAGIPFTERNDRLELDLDAIPAAAVRDSGLLLFCHPHNPLGRAFDRNELETVARFACKHDLVVCSDEIHCGIVLDPRPHIPLACIDPEIAARTITLMSPSKTYNIPGLATAFAIIPNAALRQRFKAAALGLVPHVNVLGYTAVRAAYAQAQPWRQALLTYLRQNRDLVEEAVAQNCPGVHMRHVEATYLAWLDVRELQLPDPVAFFRRAGVVLSAGETFGADGYVRLNFACPRALLEEGLKRIRTAVQAH
jgi:cystathionine beta-lyase